MQLIISNCVNQLLCNSFNYIANSLHNKMHATKYYFDLSCKPYSIFEKVATLPAVYSIFHKRNSFYTFL